MGYRAGKKNGREDKLFLDNCERKKKNVQENRY